MTAHCVPKVFDADCSIKYWAGIKFSNSTPNITGIVLGILFYERTFCFLKLNNNAVGEESKRQHLLFSGVQKKIIFHHLPRQCDDHDKFREFLSRIQKGEHLFLSLINSKTLESRSRTIHFYWTDIDSIDCYNKKSKNGSITWTACLRMVVRGLKLAKGSNQNSADCVSN